MPYFEKIPGERIYLSPMDTGDLEIYTKWMNDIEVTRWLGMAGGVYSLPAERAYLESATKDVNNYQFAIVLREGDRLLGNIGLMDVNQVCRRATLGIFIGEAADRSKGFGAEAIKLLLGYGFKWLGLRNIDLHVNSGNARAIACYKKAGFREYGRRHGAVFADGQWYDDVLMEALAQDIL
ncbi:MAG: GNAT family N-acetyltransferase [Oscillospiraceae bacterium]|jgi:RimJ/RimL family protein N-acetyltransferase|nr:GNAT family N-acetyltransferase [Oscillospiraceae bacterium]